MVVTEEGIQLHLQEESAMDWSKLDVGPEQEREDFLNLLYKYHNLFHSAPGRTNLVRHVIRTTGPPIRQPAALKETVTEEINKMLEKQVIRPSCSPWSSPVVMVRKPNGLWRFCIDFRRVNDVTHKDAYPLPRIDATLESLGGSTLFSTLDLASGYWQVELDKERFSTQNGHYEFNVMPFGLTNALFKD